MSRLLQLRGVVILRAVHETEVGMTLGEKIHEVRQARGWSQRELARRAMVRRRARGVDSAPSHLLPPQRISRGDLGAVIDRAAPLQQARAIRCRSNVDSRSAGLGVALPWTPRHKT